MEREMDSLPDRNREAKWNNTETDTETRLGEGTTERLVILCGENLFFRSSRV